MIIRDYDRTCLLVWPEWGSSGIWHPLQRGVDGAVRMVSYETIGLPDALAIEFTRWIEKYDDYLPENPDAFDWEVFDTEGFRLAEALANFTKGTFVVEYKNKLIGPTV